MSALEDWYSGPLQAEESFFLEEEEDAFNGAIQSMIDDLVKEYTPQQVNALCPMQLISQMNETLSKESNFFGQILYVKGIFKQGNGTLYSNGYYYDNLKDENNNTQVKILVPASIRSEMRPDSLVIVRGMVTKKIDAFKSSVELQFRVDSIVEEVKAQAIDKDDQRRIELRQKKVVSGFKNVDSILETILLKNEHPRVALLLAQGSITLGDFESGKRAASVEIKFVEERITFTQTSQLCAKLRSLDQQGYNAIALVRGGGIDSKTDVDKFKKEIEKSDNKNKELMKQLTNLQDQLKKQADTLKTQTDSLTKLQTTNNDLNKSVQQLTVQHSLATKERDFAQDKVKQLEGQLKVKVYN